MISGNLIDLIGGQKAYCVVYLIYVVSIAVALLITLRFQMSQKHAKNY